MDEIELCSKCEAYNKHHQDHMVDSSHLWHEPCPATRKKNINIDEVLRKVTEELKDE